MGINKDCYLTRKVKLKDVMFDIDGSYKKLDDAISICNKLTIHTYQFMRLFILYNYEKGKNLPYLTLKCPKTDTTNL